MANQKNKKNKNKQHQNHQPKEAPREMVTLEFDDGVEQECYVEGVFASEGRDYMAVVPDNGSGDVYIYRYIQEDDENYRIADEPDTAKFEAAIRVYEKLKGYDGPIPEKAEAAEEPAEEAIEEATEEPAEEAIEEATEEPAEEVAEEVTEEAAEEPAE